MDDIADSSKHSDSSQPVSNQADNFTAPAPRYSLCPFCHSYMETVEDLQRHYAWHSIEVLKQTSDISLHPPIQVRVSEDNGNNPEASTDSASFPTLIIQAEIRGAIDAINKFEDEITNSDPNDYLAIAHRLISDLEKKRDTKAL